MSDLTKRLRGMYDTVQHPSVFEAADLIDAIDAPHNNTRHVQVCDFCHDAWPCWTHRMIHPEVEA